VRTKFDIFHCPSATTIERHKIDQLVHDFVTYQNNSGLSNG